MQETKSMLQGRDRIETMDCREKKHHRGEGAKAASNLGPVWDTAVCLPFPDAGSVPGGLGGPGDA